MTGERSQMESLPAIFSSLIGQALSLLSTQDFGDQLQSPKEDALMGPTWDSDSNTYRW